MAFDPGDLLPMLPAQPGVCQTCHQPAGTFPRCYPCNAAWRQNDALHGMPVLPISLASDPYPLRAALWKYKESADGTDAARDIAALLDEFGWNHGRCLAQQAGVDRFDVITWVPSSKDRPGEHPLVDLLERTRWANGRLAELLRPGGAGEAHKEPRADRFLADPRARGHRILIVDDTWTRGTNGLSAALALLEAGASAVALMAIGRWFVLDRDEGTRAYVESSLALGFDPKHCVFCENRPKAWVN